MANAPGPVAIQQALSCWNAVRSRLLAEDADLAQDEAQLVTLLGAECEDLTEIEHRLARAVVAAAALADTADAMAGNLISRRERYKRRARTYKAALMAIMDATGERRCEFADLTIYTRIGVPAVIVTDEAQIPERFVRTETVRKVDRVALREALTEGQAVEGAMLSNGSAALTVRTK